MDKSLPKKLHPYSYWGVQFNDSSGLEQIADCPLCSKPDFFYCNEMSGAFDCKRCGKQGSWRDFLEYVHSKYLKETTDEILLLFVKAKGVPLPVLRRWKMAFRKDIYFFPVYDANEEVVDLRRFKLLDGSGAKENKTSGGDNILLGIKQLKDKERKEETIYICEGSLDAFCLDWLLRRLKKPGIVLAVPGANNFKSEWGHPFEKRNVVICYDNDAAGYGKLDLESKRPKATGSLKAASCLMPFVNSLKYIVWPDKCKKGYDLRDLINEYKTKPKQCYTVFEAYISSKHKYCDINEALNKEPEYDPNHINIPLEDVLAAARENYKIDDKFERGIKLALATVISQSIPGNVNIWLFLVGPPGTGKTLIIDMFQKSKRVVHESTLSSKALISGFNLGSGNVLLEDFSVLAQVNNKCLALKDFTEIISKSEQEMEEIFSILRGAFDGNVRRPYGNGIREFDCNFSMLAGVTNVISKFDNTALGERFLKYDVHNEKMTREEEEAIQEAAFTSQLLGGSSVNTLHQLVTEFLKNNYDFSGAALMGLRPQWFADQVKPLANLVAHIRTNIEYHERGEKSGHQIYEPIKESGTRITIQLEKTAMSLAIIEAKPQIDQEIYDTIKAVALATIKGFKLSVITFLISNPRSTEPEIRAGLATKGVWGFISELEQLKLVYREEEITKKGRSHEKKIIRFSLTKVIIDLWNRSKL